VNKKLKTGTRVETKVVDGVLRIVGYESIQSWKKYVKSRIWWYKCIDEATLRTVHSSLCGTMEVIVKSE